MVVGHTQHDVPVVLENASKVNPAEIITGKCVDSDTTRLRAYARSRYARPHARVTHPRDYDAVVRRELPTASLNVYRSTLSRVWKPATERKVLIDVALFDSSRRFLFFYDPCRISLAAINIYVRMSNQDLSLYQIMLRVRTQATNESS